MNHRAETQSVKRLLLSMGIPVKAVRHGTGTARSWLHIKVGYEMNDELDRKAIRLTQEVTGRHGDYDGNILIKH